MKQTYFEFWIPRNQHWGFLWFSLFRGTQHRQYSYHGNISTPVLMGLGSLGSLGSLSSLSRGGPHNGCSGCSGGTLRLRPRWCRSRRWRSRWSGASGASCCSWRSWRPRSQESWSRRSRSRRSRSARRPLMLKWKLSSHSHGKHNIKVSKVSRYINQDVTFCCSSWFVIGVHHSASPSIFSFCVWSVPFHILWTTTCKWIFFLERLEQFPRDMCEGQSGDLLLWRPATFLICSVHLCPFIKKVSQIFKQISHFCLNSWSSFP